MTEKDNLMKMLKGDMPEWLPFDTLGVKHEGIDPVITGARINIMGRASGKPDIFGVEYTGSDSTGGASMPAPNNFILKDISDWPKIIKVPDINDYNFDELARKGLEGIDRSKTAVSVGIFNGYFQSLMAFMGFSEGLFTMACDPEEVYNLFEYMAGFFDEVAVRLIDAVRPDIFNISDDVASAQNTFMSYDMWCKLVKPFQIRLVKHANELGIPISMHCCGKCDHLVDDWVDFGVKIWDPVQTMNDISAIKEKYGRSLILNGCGSHADAFLFSWSTEEEVRECMRKKIDSYAPNGGYICRGYVVAAKGDETVAPRRYWVGDEYLKYGRNWYQNH
ncbi:MAG: hypothetical protein IKD37_03300 [Clostridia bacterium]|nr:hypothetical protein [Oscillospiraceae bacterium]MBR4057391.1 hypothetical protein [Oscillospiraceae bacterium]MBR7184615.1 hypothetical protein [Clostridia bacterium]